MSAFDGVDHVHWYGDRDVETWLRVGSIIGLPILILLLLGMHDKMTGESVLAVGALVVLE
jgi:hypothetical protein